jgi:hypothetical protein
MLNFVNCTVAIYRNNPTLQREISSPVFEGDAYIEPVHTPMLEFDWPVAPHISDQAKMTDQWSVLLGEEDQIANEYIPEPGDVITVTDKFFLNGAYLPISGPRSYPDQDGPDQGYTEIITIRTRKS